MRLRNRAVCLAALTLCLGATHAQELQLLSEVSDGELALEGERRIELVGFEGTVAVRGGAAGTLRYACRSLDSRREQRSIGLYVEGETLILQPVDENDVEPRLLEIAVPPELATSIFLDNSTVRVNAVQGDLQVEGRDLDVDVRGLGGSLELFQGGGKAYLLGVDRDVTIEAVDIELDGRLIGATLSMDLKDSRGKVQEIPAASRIVLDKTALSIFASGGEIEIVSTGGQIELGRVFGTSRLELSETPLIAEDLRAAIEIETDAGVTLKDARGPVTLRAFGGEITAVGIAGDLSAELSGVKASFDRLQAGASISGDDLQLSLKNVRGNAQVRTSASNVEVENVNGELDLENDFGDVEVRAVERKVTLRVRGEDVSVTRLKGPLELRAEATHVRVGWIELGQGDSYVENTTGDVTAMLPPQGGCKLTLKSGYGSIVSSVPGLDVEEGEKSFNGSLRNGSRPKLEMIADGNLTLGQNRARPAATRPRPAAKAKRPTGDRRQ